MSFSLLVVFVALVALAASRMYFRSQQMTRAVAAQIHEAVPPSEPLFFMAIGELEPLEDNSPTPPRPLPAVVIPPPAVVFPNVKLKKGFSRKQRWYTTRNPRPKKSKFRW